MAAVTSRLSPAACPRSGRKARGRATAAPSAATGRSVGCASWQHLTLRGRSRGQQLDGDVPVGRDRAIIRTAGTAVLPAMALHCGHSASLRLDKLEPEHCYGQVSATRFTAATLMPLTPPAPMSMPLTDIRWPTKGSSCVSDELERHCPSPKRTTGVLRGRPRVLDALGSGRALSVQSPAFGQGSRPRGRACWREARRSRPSG